MTNPAQRQSQRPVRRDRLIREHIHDTYKMRSKIPEPARCPDCGAVYQKGRWVWSAAPEGARDCTCPACHRVRDRMPAGFLTLSGEFLTAHRGEILALARNIEAKEKAEHPLRRIMDIEQQNGTALITTSDMALAREIGVAVHHAYKGGELNYQYTDEANFLEVKWRR